MASWTSVSAYWATPALSPVANAVANGDHDESKTCWATLTSTRVAVVPSTGDCAGGVAEGVDEDGTGGIDDPVGGDDSVGARALGTDGAGDAEWDVRATPVPTEIATSTTTTVTTVIVVVTLRLNHLTRDFGWAVPKLMSAPWSRVVVSGWSTCGSGVPGAGWRTCSWDSGLVGALRFGPITHPRGTGGAGVEASWGQPGAGCGPGSDSLIGRLSVNPGTRVHVDPPHMRTHARRRPGLDGVRPQMSPHPKGLSACNCAALTRERRCPAGRDERVQDPPRRVRNVAKRPGATRHHVHFPRFSPTIRPASASTLV